MINAPVPSEIDGLPRATHALLHRGMALYGTDRAGAAFLFGFAQSRAPASLALYRVLVKFYNRVGQFDAAYEMAEQGLAEAARLGNFPPDWRAWTLELLVGNEACFALQTLKAMAFLELRRGNGDSSAGMLERLRLLDPSDGTGSSVVAALAEGI
ncbi:MAG: hypothetical protein ACLPXB_15645 [Thiobacillaceae bacterium]